MTDHDPAGGAELRALVQSLSFRQPSTPPRSTRTSETAQHSADVAPGCADAPQVEQAEPPEGKASQRGDSAAKALTLCARPRCGKALPAQRRADRVFCSASCRVMACRASKPAPALSPLDELTDDQLRALQQEADRPALPRVARARLAEMRAEGRKPTPVVYEREDGRR